MATQEQLYTIGRDSVMRLTSLSADLIPYRRKGEWVLNITEPGDYIHVIEIPNVDYKLGFYQQTGKFSETSPFRAAAGEWTPETFPANDNNGLVTEYKYVMDSTYYYSMYQPQQKNPDFPFDTSAPDFDWDEYEQWRQENPGIYEWMPLPYTKVTLWVHAEEAIGDVVMKWMFPYKDNQSIVWVDKPNDKDITLPQLLTQIGPNLIKLPYRINHNNVFTYNDTLYSYYQTPTLLDKLEYEKPTPGNLIELGKSEVGWMIGGWENNHIQKMLKFDCNKCLPHLIDHTFAYNPSLDSSYYEKVGTALDGFLFNIGDIQDLYIPSGSSGDATKCGFISPFRESNVKAYPDWFFELLDIYGRFFEKRVELGYVGMTALAPLFDFYFDDVGLYSSSLQPGKGDNILRFPDILNGSHLSNYETHGYAVGDTHYSCTKLWQGIDFLHSILDFRRVDPWTSAQGAPLRKIQNIPLFGGIQEKGKHIAEEGSNVDAVIYVQYCSFLDSLTFCNSGDEAIVIGDNKSVRLTLLLDCGYEQVPYKETNVTDQATYEQFKDDPYYVTSLPEYSHFNRDSMVELFNSLPRFIIEGEMMTGMAYGNISITSTLGNSTDAGGAGNLTDEEIAIATSKGWTVSLQ